MRAERIRVTGVVQGVGFRPTVWRLAGDCGIVGEVLNDAEGVLIHAWGEPGAIDEFCRRIRDEPPPLATIRDLERRPVDRPGSAPADFQIVASAAGAVRTEVAADAATCAACVDDIRDPGNRRFRYPFTNCTHCGPRLSIIRSIPYDRATTSMAEFVMCGDCQSEYEDPADRRFHAQPNACPVCGPRVWLESADGDRLKRPEDGDWVLQAARLIGQGHIVAVKGIGGFHLACDASSDAAVDRLRQRKHRYQKALAMMGRDLDMVERYVSINDAERAALQDRSGPIVVMARKAGADELARGIAPGQNTLGFMLPYTPLHHLLMASVSAPIVLTSGNRSDEPQVIDNDEARAGLADIADFFLMHDRDIVNRLDDSVLRFADGQLRFLRRARGYAPQAVPLPGGLEQADGILAMGAELKNTFCLVKQGKAVVSQHIGDMEQGESTRDFLRNIDLYRELFELEARSVAVDRHPEYIPTKIGQQQAVADGLVEVQHHHAHIAGCMAEHGWALDRGPVLGIALDGLGYGEDQTIWGGEFLRADYRGFQRLGRFLPVAMPGGTRAILEPWRNAWAHLDAALGWDAVTERFGELDCIRFLQSMPLGNLARMVERKLNSPVASSCGRLFDAAAALLGVCPSSVAHEGQAAVELEALASAARDPADRGYPVALSRQGMVTLTWAPLWSAFLGDLADGVSRPVIAARFHRGLADGVADLAVELCGQSRLTAVVLSGGVFQNRFLLEAVSSRIRGSRLEVLAPVAFPANDGGIALGQAVVAAARCATPRG
ncbi:MAG: carbamoyltransferase HypF [Xanthomonadales bacterium]|nr:carbamoyltransferase HypF [Xanthomonadales bacterium]